MHYPYLIYCSTPTTIDAVALWISKISSFNGTALLQAHTPLKSIYVQSRRSCTLNLQCLKTQHHDGNMRRKVFVLIRRAHQDWIILPLSTQSVYAPSARKEEKIIGRRRKSPTEVKCRKQDQKKSTINYKLFVYSGTSHIKANPPCYLPSSRKKNSLFSLPHCNSTSVQSAIAKPALPKHR